MTNLITLEEYKTDQNLTKADQDAVLEQLITQVSAIINAYIGKSFVAGGTEVNEIISLDYDSDVIFLDNYPVESIVSLESFGPLYPYDSTVRFPVPDTVYILDKEDGRLIRTSGVWNKGQGVISVTYIVGGASDVTEVPAELKRVTIDLVKYYKHEEYKDSKSLKGATINNNTGSGNSNSPSTNFPPHIQRILDLYT